MRTGVVLSILNEGNCYSSLRSLSVSLGSAVCRELEYRNIYLLVWDELWKTYYKGKWLNITSSNQDLCTCASGGGESQGSCCYLTAVCEEVSHWKYVHFRPRKHRELCRVLNVRSSQPQSMDQPGDAQSTGEEHGDDGEYLLVIKLQSKLSPGDLSGLIVVRFREPLAKDTTPQLLAKKAHKASKLLISTVSNAYYIALHCDRVSRSLAENTFILSLTRICQSTNVPEVFAKVDEALRLYRSLRLSAVMATDDVNRELVQVWHNRDADCLECKPIPIDCGPISRCLFAGEAQVVSLSQVRSMHRSTPGRSSRRSTGGDTTDRNFTSPHRRSPKSALLIPPAPGGGVGCSTYQGWPEFGGSCPSPLTQFHDDNPPPSPGLISKVQGCHLKTVSEKQGCRLLAPLVGANGVTKVVMVIDRKLDLMADEAAGEYASPSSTTDYDAFMSPSLFRVLQDMVRTVSTNMKLQSAINDFVMTTLIAQNQRRRESAPSHCIIEFVYGVIPTKHQSSDDPLESSSLDPKSVLTSYLQEQQSKTRRASAPSNLSPSNLLDLHMDGGDSSLGSAATAVQDLWNQSVCIDYFKMTNDEFFEFFDYCLVQYNHVESSDRLSRRSFFDYITNAYHQTNPYHNKYHAIQVVHVTWHIVRALKESMSTPGFASSTTTCRLRPDGINSGAASKSNMVPASSPRTQPPEIFDELSYCLLLAALIHDVDHIGVTNNYLIATSHPLSILYNDRSVLEQHHCAFAFSALKQRPHIDLIRSRNLRKHIIEMVLATDMAMHIALMSSLSHLATLSLDNYNDDNWTKLGEIILHASDLSNQLTPFPYFMRWAGLCIEEFNRQVDLELENNVPVTSFMNCRSDTSRIEMELGFLEFVVLPLWQPLTVIEPKLTAWLETGRANSEFWRRCLEKLGGGHHAPLTSKTPTEEVSQEEGRDLSTGNSSDQGEEDDDAFNLDGYLVTPRIVDNLTDHGVINRFIDKWNQSAKSLFEIELEWH